MASFNWPPFHKFNPLTNHELPLVRFLFAHMEYFGEYSEEYSLEYYFLKFFQINKFKVGQLIFGVY